MYGLKLDIKLPKEVLEQVQTKLAEVWQLGFWMGLGWGALAGLVVGLLLAWCFQGGGSMWRPFLVTGLILAGVWWAYLPGGPASGTAPAAPSPGPQPAPEPEPKPRRWPPWRPKAEQGQDVGKITLGGQVGPEGQEVHIDLPLGQRIRNIGSKRDGAGMCVSTSMTMAARWHNMRDWETWRDWCAQFPGGGYPSKMDRQIEQYAKEKSIPKPPYLQYEGKDLAILREALSWGLLPSITYSGRDGVRYRSSIAHMVNLVYLDDTSAAIMDNNGKAEELIWMSSSEFADRWIGGRSGWAHFWLLSPPPPPPRGIR